MKKIISLLSAIAILFTLVTNVAFAASDRVYFNETRDGDTLVLQMVMDIATVKVYSGTAMASLENIIKAGGEVVAAYEDEDDDGNPIMVTAKKGQATTFAYNPANYMLSAGIANADGLSKGEGIVLGEITIDLSNVAGGTYVTKENPDTSKKNNMCKKSGDEITFSFDIVGHEFVVEGDEATVTETTAIKTNDMHGQETFASKMTFTDVANPGVVIEKGAETKKFDLPSGVVGGWTDVIAIVRYKKADVVAGDIFKVFIASNGEKVDANKYVKYEVTAADAAAEE